MGVKHKKGQPFACENSERFLLSLHMKTHQDESIQEPTNKIKISCKKCDFQALSFLILDAHMEETHGKKRKRKVIPEYMKKCNNCDFITQNKEDFDTHVSSTHVNVSVKLCTGNSQFIHLKL